jgi:hypothetical protein
VAAHENENWLEEIELMEKALQNFYIAHEECDALCEGPFDHQGLPDFYSAIAGKHDCNVSNGFRSCHLRLIVSTQICHCKFPSKMSCQCSRQGVLALLESSGMACPLKEMLTPYCIPTAWKGEIMTANG